MATVDRLVILSTVLFSIAGLLVLLSISRPRWILSVNQGEHPDPREATEGPFTAAHRRHSPQVYDRLLSRDSGRVQMDARNKLTTFSSFFTATFVTSSPVVRHSQSHTDRETRGLSRLFSAPLTTPAARFR